MMTPLEYHTDKQLQMVGDKQVTVISKTPVFGSDADRKCVITGVENGLYRIFSKYMG